jgi:hypothetical protein
MRSTITAMSSLIRPHDRIGQNWYTLADFTFHKKPALVRFGCVHNLGDYGIPRDTALLISSVRDR